MAFASTENRRNMKGIKLISSLRSIRLGPLTLKNSAFLTVGQLDCCEPQSET